MATCIHIYIYAYIFQTYIIFYCVLSSLYIIIHSLPVEIVPCFKAISVQIPILLTHWGLAKQVMAWCLSGVKPLPKPKMTYCQSTPRFKVWWNLNQNTASFIEQNVFEIIVILFWCYIPTPSFSDLIRHFDIYHSSVLNRIIFFSRQNAFKNIASKMDVISIFIIIQYWTKLFVKFLLSIWFQKWL